MIRLTYLCVLFLLVISPVFGYIDPGTGSMLFSFLTGLAVTLYFFLKNCLLRLKNLSIRTNKAIIGEKPTFVFYSEGGRYWNVFKPIVEEFHRRGITCSYFTSDLADPGLQFQSNYIQVRFIGEGNKAYHTLNFLEADICITTTPGLDVLQFKRSPGVKHYIHILHAVTDATLYRLFGLDYYDSVFLTGPYQIKDLRTLERLRGTKPKRLEVVGCTYLDELALIAKSIVASPPLETTTKTVLVAPSWGENGMLRRFGMKLLRPLAESGYHVIIRPHPQSFISELPTINKLKKELAHYSSVEWNEDRENIYVLSRADILISDFSGVIFDYLFLFGRPVVYADFNFDLRPYDAADVDLEPWTFRTLRAIAHPLKEEEFFKIGSYLNSLEENKDRNLALAKAREEAYANPGFAGVYATDQLLKIHSEL
ncbi:CDP-glycerol glycerophosphotransferase family protein [Gracilinema caldarium]|uniref:CDP-glycerol:poly(Glycerophosphate)glycerophosphotransferase n=1 Tax=Gracilinema caldarium (strain ATCC 51460 / DSM 7334 / H1) TaxID=744872 RepID=F8F0X4_GRAC1|nr:CDP-glycerol glycerophosphotransferase family protein [Gracilinema caldarium]AEJ20260.1 CDP-glycerol:poly(glycerophosphate)glycerophosphotransferase [Gracilinema caldarium DSM 7334]